MARKDLTLTNLSGLDRDAKNFNNFRNADQIRGEFSEFESEQKLRNLFGNSYNEVLARANTLNSIAADDIGRVIEGSPILDPNDPLFGATSFPIFVQPDDWNRLSTPNLLGLFENSTPPLLIPDFSLPTSLDNPIVDDLGLNIVYSENNRGLYGTNKNLDGSFSNLVPKDADKLFEIPEYAIWEKGEFKPKKFLYVVTNDDRLVITEQDRGARWGHIELANGSNVKAAGEGRNTYHGVEFDLASGHYLPYGQEAVDIASKAFLDSGFATKQPIYIPKVYDFSKGEWVKINE